ncbi:NAD(P)-dependent alcohol dehydrogenase [Streptomyces sp. ATexAB-D23]|uniref:NAD(P)-dependent alcohol dehydrogenase n=1 Tax=unclassified Streptomyces TaxID=2593676 RepID=UPI000382C7BB|nr:NAD(P)-dependent alcohol dehydrogenase [Streptomyces sp. ATexAB-D23]MYY06920.1 alcohol dehydrogenase catalytic domain-containing protein [Streptomyces sp. SID4913]
MRRVRAAVTDAPGAPFTVRDADLEDPRPHEVLVRMTAAGLCHTDLAMAGTWPPRLTPMVFGHEGAGRVEAVGARVTGLSAGDHVCLTFASCGACEQCAADHPAYCLAARTLNLSGGRDDATSPLSMDGAPLYAGFFGQSSFATYAVVHERGAVKVPSGLPPSVAAPLGCGGQTGAGTVLNRLRPEPGSSLVVLGAGGVGLSALMAAVAVGCDPVVAVDPVASRRELALSLGAAAALAPGGGLAAALRELTGGGAHHVVETTGRPETVRRAVGALRPRGALALLGLGGEVTFDVMGLLAKGVRVHGVVEGDSDPGRFIPELIALHGRGLFPLDRLVTTFPFEEIGRAVAAMRDGSVVKPVLTF